MKDCLGFFSFVEAVSKFEVCNFGSYLLKTFGMVSLKGNHMLTCCYYAKDHDNIVYSTIGMWLQIRSLEEETTNIYKIPQRKIVRQKTS